MISNKTLSLQKEMDRKENERAEQERQRMRRLMLEGIIGPQELKEDSVLWREYKIRRDGIEPYKGSRRKASWLTLILLYNS